MSVLDASTGERVVVVPLYCCRSERSRLAGCEDLGPFAVVVFFSFFPPRVVSFWLYLRV